MSRRNVPYIHFHSTKKGFHLKTCTEREELERIFVLKMFHIQHYELNQLCRIFKTCLFGTVAWPPVLLLAAFSRTAHPNNVTLDTVLPLVPEQYTCHDIVPSTSSAININVYASFGLQKLTRTSPETQHAVRRCNR